MLPRIGFERKNLKITRTISDLQVAILLTKESVIRFLLTFSTFLERNFFAKYVWVGAQYLNETNLLLQNQATTSKPKTFPTKMYH